MNVPRLLPVVPALLLLAGCPLLDPKKPQRPPPAPAGAPVAAPQGVTPVTPQPTALPVVSGDVCTQPSPARMTIDASLMESVETLIGGDFEDESRLPVVAGAAGSRVSSARSGKWAWSLPQAGTVAAAFSPEKAVDMHFSAWVRSAGAPIQARLSVGGARGGGGGQPPGGAMPTDRPPMPGGPRGGQMQDGPPDGQRPPGGQGGRPNGAPGARPGLPGGGPGPGGRPPGGGQGGQGGQGGPPSHAGEWFTVGSEWTEVTLDEKFPNTVPTALLTVETTGAASVDDLSIHAPAWRKADGPRNVGGIQVPATPAAPFLFAVLVHVEDDPQFRLGGDRWEATTLVLEKLAETLHRHGGALTIQPESDWIEGGEANARQSGRANRVTGLARSYGVHFSTHTHGPSCVDSSGRGYSNSDCRLHPEYSKDVSEANTLAYIQERQRLIQQVTGEFPSDHNGNFDLASFGSFPSIGVVTLSGFKDHRDQSGLPSLYTNPWRPTGTDAAATLDSFLQPNPNGPVVYVPGAGVTLTRSPARLPDQLARVTSQVLRFADPTRVNTFYTILAESAFSPPAGTDRASYYTGGGLDRDVGAVESLLTVLIDPLVATGYIKWASLPEMGAWYLAQEKSCRAR